MKFKQIWPLKLQVKKFTPQIINNLQLLITGGLSLARKGLYLRQVYNVNMNNQNVFY